MSRDKSPFHIKLSDLMFRKVVATEADVKMESFSLEKSKARSCVACILSTTLLKIYNRYHFTRDAWRRIPPANTRWEGERRGKESRAHSRIKTDENGEVSKSAEIPSRLAAWSKVLLLLLLLLVLLDAAGSCLSQGAESE